MPRPCYPFLPIPKLPSNTSVLTSNAASSFISSSLQADKLRSCRLDQLTCFLTVAVAISSFSLSSNGLIRARITRRPPCGGFDLVTPVPARLRAEASRTVTGHADGRVATARATLYHRAALEIFVACGFHVCQRRFVRFAFALCAAGRAPAALDVLFVVPAIVPWNHLPRLLN